MAQTSTLPLAREAARLRDRAGAASSAVRWIPLVAVVLLAFGLDAWRLSEAGLGNTYYAAAVRSMATNWKAFFFGALDPGGFITVDKPPMFLWVGALSVRAFGYNSWALLLPSAIAGAATVGLVWSLVRRFFGVFAATVAAVVLALTPITVAVDRLNLPEPFMILALTAAAVCIVRSFESRRWVWWLIAAGALVGVGFNTKMLAAWIPGPALALALVVAMRGSLRVAWRGLLVRLALLAAVTFVVSASWGLVVDAMPPSARPYIGGSTNNTVANLALGYNGFGRVEGQGGPGGRPGGSARAIPRPAIAPNNARGFGRPGSTNPGASGPGGAQGPGGIIAGQPGPLRMLDAANGGQIAWFLPFALLGGVAALWYWRRDASRRGFVALWLGWVLLYGGVFSYSQGIYHSYYTSALAPGIAALVGVAAALTVRTVRRDWRWLALPVVLVVATLAVQLMLAGRFPDFYGWVRPIAVITAVAGLVTLLVAVIRRLPVLVAAGIGLAVAGLLMLPAAWSFNEVAFASLNATLPQAGPRQGAAGRTFGSSAFDAGTSALGTWLRAREAPGAVRWDLATVSAQNAATLIAQDGLSVMAMGGFSGSDPAIDVPGFAALVARGDVRYVLASGGFGGFGGFPRGGARPGGQSILPGGLPFAPGGPAAIPQPRRGFGQPGGAPTGPGAGFGGGFPPATPGGATRASAGGVISAVQSACVAVSDPTLPAQYRGVLYDCSGSAPALEALASAQR